MSDSEAPVLIAGGGMVGLSAAAFLAQRGIRSIAIERLRASSPLPRAAFFHMRTLELFRSLGIENAVRERSAEDFVPEGAIVAVDCLSGRKLADIMPSLNEGVEALSPCRRLYLNQPSLEPILRACAREAGAAVLQGFELESLRQDAHGVTVGVRDVDGGGRRELNGSFLIAADGAHSKVRELLNIAYEGRGAFSNSLTIYFTADLSPWLADKAWSIVYVNNPALGGFFRMNRTAQAGFLAINTVGDPKRDPRAAANVSADVTEPRLIAHVRAAVGVADLPVRIDGFTRWRATASVAQFFSVGRVFIAGDAAHLMPPNGGFGGNTGIHDVHNLAWKIELVHKGHAHPQLLSTYASERKPVAHFTVEQAFTRYVTRTAPWLLAAYAPEPLAPDFDIELGYLYGCDSRVHADPRETRALPGSRAPHLWLERAGSQVSTLDLTARYLLLAGREGSNWIEQATPIAHEFGALPMDCCCIGRDLGDGGNLFPALHGISSSGAVLIRPDGFVASRFEKQGTDDAARLRSALASSLAFRPGEPFR